MSKFRRFLVARFSIFWRFGVQNGSQNGDPQKVTVDLFPQFLLQKLGLADFHGFWQFWHRFWSKFTHFCNISRTFPGCRGTTDCTESCGLARFLHPIVHISALPYASSTSRTFQIKRAGGGSSSAGSIRPPSGPGRAGSSACSPPFHTIPYHAIF